MNRVNQLISRYERIQRLRNFAIEQKNIYKKKQAEFLLTSLTINLNLITQPRTWN